MLSSIPAFLEELVRGGDASAASALVGSADEVLFEAVAGSARPGDALVREDVFDLASLTKPFVTTLALALDQAGALPLARTVGEIYPGAAPDLARRSLEDLLRHRSGLKPWFPLYHSCIGPGHVEDALLGGGLLGAPEDSYSDLGFLLWGMAAEHALGESLPVLLERYVLEPLGIEEIRWGLSSDAPPVDARPAWASGRAVESWLDTGKEAQLAVGLGLEIPMQPPPAPGQVQDGNARFLVGLGHASGHAGLFATARDVWRLGREWLRPERLLSGAVVEKALAGQGQRRLGWAVRSLRGAGTPLEAASFGHAGFTGTSLWISPPAERIFILLAHRRSPFEDFDARRRDFHRLAREAGI